MRERKKRTGVNELMKGERGKWNARRNDKTTALTPLQATVIFTAVEVIILR